MKYRISMTVIALALACTAAQASTPAQRCVAIADYSQGVAALRDEGATLADVKQFNAERASHGMRPAYDLAATIVYKNSDLPPGDVRDAMLAGCMRAIEEEQARRAR